MRSRPHPPTRLQYPKCPDAGGALTLMWKSPVLYQFQIDNRAAGPIRDTWEDAARDAVNGGYAIWVPEGIKIDSSQGAEIARLPKPWCPKCGHYYSHDGKTSNHGCDYEECYFSCRPRWIV